MSPIQWRQQYAAHDDPLEQAARAASETEDPGDTMTLQQFRDEADINIVLARFGVGDGATLPAIDLTKVDARYYGDFSNAVDLRTALEQMREAEARFMQLPAALRAKFNNQWFNLHEWVNDPKNLDEAITLKMLTPPDGYTPPGTDTTTPPTVPTPPATKPAA